MIPTKEKVNTKDEQGNDLVLDVRYPSGKVLQEAQVVYSVTWQHLVNDKKVKVKKQIDEMLAENGIWTEKEEKKKRELFDKIISLGKKLSDKTVKKTKQQGRDVAVEIIKTRQKLTELLAERSSLDANSAESLAENSKFDYLVSVCTVYNSDGKQYFKDYDDYLERRTEKAAWDAASKLAAMLYSGVDFSENFQENLIEVQFLKKFGFVDDEGNFIDKNGDRVDIEGKPFTPVEDNIDIYGNKIENGKSQFEFGGFDEGESESEVEVAE